MTDSASLDDNSKLKDVKAGEDIRISRFGSIAMYRDEKNAADGNDSSTEEVDPSCYRRVRDRVIKGYRDNEFVCLAVIAILLARAYPPLGAEYLVPDITSSWLAVIFIFILAGLGLKTEEFSKAFQRLWFNFAVQAFNFGVVSAVVFGVSRGLAAANVVSQPLADGMTICSCLPLTINMVLVLTKSSGGDEASAIFNAALGNLCGVFLSPILILGYIGVSSSVAIWDVFYKLSLRVVVPVAFGQLLQKFSPPVVRFVNEHKVRFKQAQEYCLIYIVYAVFCATFADENRNSNVGDIFIMIAVLIVLLCGLMILAWFTFKFLFPNEPTLRIVALFGATHKTVAMGVPLINSIYEDDPLVGLYTLPLLIWHPLQLLVGSFLAPRLAAWVEQEQERLGQTDPNNDATAPAASVDEETPLPDCNDATAPAASVDEETPLPDCNDATAPAASVDEETPLPDSKEGNSDAIEETDTAAKSS